MRERTWPNASLIQKENQQEETAVYEHQQDTYTGDPETSTGDSPNTHTETIREERQTPEREYSQEWKNDRTDYLSYRSYEDSVQREHRDEYRKDTDE